MMLRHVGHLLGPIALLLPAPPLDAQAGSRPRDNGGTILVSATVVTGLSSATTVRPLVLETARGQRSATIEPSDRAAAEWRLLGQANAEVQITFTLPSTLANLQSPDTPRLPIAFSRRAGRWRQDVADPREAVSFDPHESTALRFGAGAWPALYIWLGSTVFPTAATPPGAYQGTVTLTLVY